MLELLFTLIAGTTISYGSFDHCETANGMHYRRVNNGVISTRITICDGREPKNIVFTLAHELGHEYWFVYMTQKQRDDYEKICQAIPDVYRTHISKAGCHEDFADIFALVTLHREIPKGLEIKAHYIKTLLGQKKI